jgi:hypothetical protein
MPTLNCTLIQGKSHINVEHIHGCISLAQFFVLMRNLWVYAPGQQTTA